MSFTSVTNRKLIAAAEAYRKNVTSWSMMEEIGQPTQQKQLCLLSVDESSGGKGGKKKIYAKSSIQEIVEGVFDTRSWNTRLICSSSDNGRTQVYPNLWSFEELHSCAHHHISATQRQEDELCDPNSTTTFVNSSVARFTAHPPIPSDTHSLTDSSVARSWANCDCAFDTGRLLTLFLPSFSIKS